MCFVNILRFCCVLVLRLYYSDTVLAVLLFCRLTMEMVAHNRWLLAGLLLTMCLVIGGGVISRHVLSIVIRTGRTYLCMLTSLFTIVVELSRQSW